MSEDTLQLSEIPDLSGMEEPEQMPIENGWYFGTILEKREFTDKNGNDRVFESTDDLSNAGDSRNIRLQVQLKRATDGRELNVSTLVNYRPEDLSQETVQAIAAHKEKVAAKEDQWGPMFRPFNTLQKLGKLQKIAGVRSFQRNGNGGLDLHSLYGKTGYFKVADDDRNPQYKQIVDFRADKPQRAPVL